MIALATAPTAVSLDQIVAEAARVYVEAHGVPHLDWYMVGLPAFRDAIRRAVELARQPQTREDAK